MMLVKKIFIGMLGTVGPLCIVVQECKRYGRIIKATISQPTDPTAIKCRVVSVTMDNAPGQKMVTAKYLHIHTLTIKSPDWVPVVLLSYLSHDV